MYSYAIRRVLGAIPTLLIIITLAFFMMHLAPGGPFDSERRLPQEIERNIQAAYDLDKPVHQQYLIYLNRLMHGDFGPSFKNKDFSVAELIALGFPVSARLGISAILVSTVAGILLGVAAALNQNRVGDFGVMAFAMAGITIPTFVTAPLLTLIFGVYGIHIFGTHFSLPVGGWEGGKLANMVLPVFALALPQIAIISRLMRGSMIEVMHSSYIRTAQAKGLSWHRVVIRHALPAALIPLVSYLGPAVAEIVTGSLIIEQIFGLPGIGRYFVLGALNRDYTLVMGVVIFYATIIIFLNLVADLLYRVLDPRVRHRE